MNRCRAMDDELLDVALGNAASEAFRAHVRACAACAAELERRRALAQRMSAAVERLARSEPPSQLLEHITARARSALRQPPRSVTWRWAAVGAALAAAAAGLAFGVRGLPPPPARGADVGALSAWRSPTRVLLQTHGSVLYAPLDRVTVPSRSSRT